MSTPQTAPAKQLCDKHTHPKPAQGRKAKASGEGALTIVIKLGTSSICDEVTHFPLLSTLSLIVETILKLKAQGHRVVLVTSGAIGVGLRRLNLASKPKDLAKVQVKKLTLSCLSLPCLVSLVLMTKTSLFVVYHVYRPSLLWVRAGS